MTVTWDPAGTEVAPVNCTAVDIWLSIDGGYTYPDSLKLATAVPNTGQTKVLVPALDTQTARVKVKGNQNVFFDISDENFSIIDNTGILPTLSNIDLAISADHSQDQLFISFQLEKVQRTSLSIFDMQGRVIWQEGMNTSGYMRRGSPNVPF